MSYSRFASINLLGLFVLRSQSSALSSSGTCATWFLYLLQLWLQTHRFLFVLISESNYTARLKISIYTFLSPYPTTHFLFKNVPSHSHIHIQQSICTPNSSYVLYYTLNPSNCPFIQTISVFPFSNLILNFLSLHLSKISASSSLNFPITFPHFLSLVCNINP